MVAAALLHTTAGLGSCLGIENSHPRAEVVAAATLVHTTAGLGSCFGFVNLISERLLRDEICKIKALGGAERRMLSPCALGLGSWFWISDCHVNMTMRMYVNVTCVAGRQRPTRAPHAGDPPW